MVGFFPIEVGNRAPAIIFTLFLALAFASTWRTRLPIGSYVVATALAYAPVRFGLDFMRIEHGAGGDPRYAGLTPAQWACLGLVAIGFRLWWHVRASSAGSDPTADRAGH